MYDRHKPIIKWYEYDARKLYQTAESEDVTGDAGGQESSAEAAPAAMEETGEVLTDAVEAAGGSDAPLSGSELDDEVARIMAAFSGAKQNGVDDVFAMMAAEVDAGGSVQADEEPADDVPQESVGDSEEDLLASILAPKQNNVDDLVAKAREG